jgi:hypothetical protein
LINCGKGKVVLRNAGWVEDILGFMVRERGSVIWRAGGETSGPKRRKAAWAVHEPQIPSSSHTRTSPLHLQLGTAVGMDPVLTAPSHSHKTVKVAASTLKV